MTTTEHTFSEAAETAAAYLHAAQYLAGLNDREAFPWVNELRAEATRVEHRVEAETLIGSKILDFIITAKPSKTPAEIGAYVSQFFKGGITYREGDVLRIGHKPVPVDELTARDDREF